MGVPHTTARLPAAAVERAGVAKRATAVAQVDAPEVPSVDALLHHTSDLLDAVFSSSPVAMIAGDLGGDVVLWNPAAERLYGYSEEEILGRPLERLVPDGELAAHRAHRDEVRTGRALLSLDSAGVRKDGTEVAVSLSYAPMHDQNARVVGVMVIAEDIARRKAAEDELRRVNAEFDERVRERMLSLAETNTELEAFAYSVAHDLRGPLRAMDGFCEALGEDYDDRLDDTGRDYLHRIRRASQHMARLIDDLLSLSRLTRGEIRREPCDLTALAEDVGLELRARAPGRSVELMIQKGLRAECDPRLVRSLLHNLLENAWKFTSRRPDARVEVGLADCRGTDVFFVRDNGVGFDMAYADHLFRPFQPLHKPSEFEGNGIGLATVQRIVDRHGGRVTAHAAVGEGAAIYFTLSAAEVE